MGEKEENEEIDLINNPNDLLEPFKVYVRIRPFLKKEIIKLKRSNSSSILPGGNNFFNPKNIESIFSVSKNTLYVHDYKHDYKHQKKDKKYYFNDIFTEKNNNKDVFDISIKPIINNIMKGYNSTALAYGVTGTGKTHTIFGDLVVQNGEEGIAIKACDYLFNELSSKYFEDQCFIKISYIEIYNENVIDLLNNENSPCSNLMIIEDPNKGVYCPNVKEYVINSCTELKKIIIKGNKRRTMAPTNQNKFSSRSHAILQISLERKSYNEENDNFDIFFSKFLMVDLAGSERGGLEKGKRREEGANINKSLFTLGSCINILSDKNKTGTFIPYRDSKLTRLLKDSLGGNILTVMLVCVSPAKESYEESISSLNYAMRAKKIKKKIVQNKKEVDILECNSNLYFNDNNNNNQYEEIIGSLRNEIYQLKNIIKEQQNILRTKNLNNINLNLNNETLNLEDESIIKEKPDVTNNIDKIFFNEGSTISNIQINDSQINLKTNKNIPPTINTSLNNNNILNEIDLDKYNKFFEEIKNKDFEIDSLQVQIENLKKDKNNLELFLEKNHLEKKRNENTKEDNNNYINIEKKYTLIKKYYDKFLEIINDKLIENIENNLLLKCNIKEINQLNKNNFKSLEILNKKLESYKINEKKEEHDCEYNNINERITNIKNNIKDNSIQKEIIHKTYNESINKKKKLKQILLSLLGDKRENSDKLINIIKDKEKLVEMNKEFQKKIENYVEIQKKKDNDINIVQREVEMLRAKLKEKERKINELKKNKTFGNNLNENGNNYIGNSSYYNYIKKNKNEINSFINKGKKNNSCVKSASNIHNNNYNNIKSNNKENKNDNKITNTKAYMYIYDASNDNIININNNNNIPFFSKKFTNKVLNNKDEKGYNKKVNNKKNNIQKSRSEVILENKNKKNKNTVNDNNNLLFKKLIFNNADDENMRINTINVIDNNMGIQKLLCQNKNPTINIIKINNNNNDKSNVNNFIIKSNKINYSKKDIINNNTRNNKKSVNLSQRRYEKFMNNHFNNISHNNNINQEDNNCMSKKINNKKLSLNEARFEKKIKNEKTDKNRDLSVELNHIQAEYFINSFKGLKLKMSKNNLYTQGNQNINIINNINSAINSNKNINNQNSTINMDINGQIETKGNDTTNFKTDQSKILKTDDIHQDLINSLRNANFKFKQK